MELDLLSAVKNVIAEMISQDGGAGYFQGPR